jgi:hypothetical protein
MARAFMAAALAEDPIRDIDEIRSPKEMNQH